MHEETDRWRKAVHGMALHMERDTFPAGSLAALRRLDIEQCDASAFWFLLEDHAPDAFGNPAAERALAVTVNGMAIAFPFHRSENRRSLGTALADCAVAEMRLLRLLRSDRGDLPGEVRRLARLMASKGEDGCFDWYGIFALAFYREGAGKIRRDIAKDYYRQEFHKQKAGEKAA